MVVFIDYYYVFTWWRTCGVRRCLCTIRCEQRTQMMEGNGRKTKMITPYNQFDNLMFNPKPNIYIQLGERKCDIIKSIYARSRIRIIRVQLASASVLLVNAKETAANAYRISYYYFASISNQFRSTSTPSADRTSGQTRKNLLNDILKTKNTRSNFIHWSRQTCAFASNFPSQMPICERNMCFVHDI